MCSSDLLARGRGAFGPQRARRIGGRGWRGGRRREGAACGWRGIGHSSTVPRARGGGQIETNESPPSDTLGKPILVVSGRLAGDHGPSGGCRVTAASRAPPAPVAKTSNEQAETGKHDRRRLGNDDELAGPEATVPRLAVIFVEGQTLSVGERASRQIGRAHV